jgi:hypothetical protein
MTLAIAVLTGLRPQLLDTTLASFVRHHADVWTSAAKIVHHNTGDQETAEILDRYRWDVRRTVDELLPIGQASQSLGDAVRQIDASYVLRLEDDWEAHPGGWVDDAMQLLERVDQVRLWKGKTSRRCLVCRRPVSWYPSDGHIVAKHAHYTHTPSLMKVDTFLGLFPYEDEREAMRKFHGRPVAVHVPGVFAHLGEGGRSLKRNGGRR